MSKAIMVLAVVAFFGCNSPKSNNEQKPRPKDLVINNSGPHPIGDTSWVKVVCDTVKGKIFAQGVFVGNGFIEECWSVHFANFLYSKEDQHYLDSIRSADTANGVFL